MAVREKCSCFHFLVFDFFHTVHSPQQPLWGQGKVTVMEKQGCEITTVQGNSVVFKQNA